MKPLSVEETIAKLEAIVAKYGEDYVYQLPTYEDESGELESCMYSNQDGTPSCIVGHVLKEVSPKYFKSVHEREWEQLDSNAVYNLSGIYQYFEERAVNLLSNVQFDQDDGVTWGEAVEESVLLFK